MKKLVSSLLLAAACAFGAGAAEQKPVVTIHTDIYAEFGETNAFTLVIGGTERGYIDVDCGFGPVEYELEPAYFDQTSQSVRGTIISCHVNEEGLVRIYCDDPTRIEYFNGLGCYIRNIEFEYPEELTVLNLEHNVLESLDTSRMTKLQALYVSDNPFDKEQFDITVDMPDLQILEISIIENICPTFDFGHFPALVSVDAMSTYGLAKADTSKCPQLVRLSLDNTNVSSVNLSKNPNLRILNVSDTRVTELDLTHTPYLQQLYASHNAQMNHEYKIRELKLHNNREMIYMFVSGNALTTLDCSGMKNLRELSAAKNNLTSINLDGCVSLENVNLKGNRLDFNSLPIDPGTWSEYLGQQQDIQLPRSIAVGHAIDLKSKVIRDDSQTYATVMSVSRLNPGSVQPVSEDFWSFSDEGVLTFTSAPADSVYVEFYNPLFQDFTLQTSRFKVKNADEYGKPTLAFMFNPIYAGNGDKIEFGIGIDGASHENPHTIHVDFGNGETREFDVTGSDDNMTTISAIKPSYGAIRVYTEGDDVVTAVRIEDIYSSVVDVTRLEELRYLKLRNLELYELDLSWNRCLETLDVTGNHFERGLDLKGANGWYGKNVLRNLTLSNNELVEVEFNDVFMLKHLDLSHNKISFFNFKDADNLEYIDMSYNQLTDLVINYCSALREGRFDHNQIVSVRMPEENNVEKFTINDNKLTLATLPEHGLMRDEDYIYAPQADIQIPVKGPGHNLSSQYIVIDGQATVFTWKTTTGETLVEGEDYTIEDGVTMFKDSTIGKNLYCEISHPAFPEFKGNKVLKTTVINSAGMPTNCLATFVTPKGGESVRLSMKALRPSTAIYIDWTGQNELTQYILTNETYTVFEATTTAGAEVKVYSYSNVSNLCVFSVTGATMSSIDASGMMQLTMFAVNGANLSDNKIKYPRVSALTEISLEGNNLTTFDFSPFTNLQYVSLDHNKIKHLDVSNASSKLAVLSASYNNMESISFGNHYNLWSLMLTGNKLTEIDLSGVPALEQVTLNENELDHVDLDDLANLRAIYLDNNRFNFSNLPLPRSQWVVYTYGNQPEIKIEDGAVVDLSYLAEREGVQTKFIWYYDIPTIDLSTGEITGEELFVDDEYTIENGVTTFMTDIPRATCLMTNALFPNMFLITNTIRGVSGIESVAVDSQMRVSAEGRTVTVTGVDNGSVAQLIAADGRVVAAAKAIDGTATLQAGTEGIYIVATAKGSAKIAIR